MSKTDLLHTSLPQLFSCWAKEETPKSGTRGENTLQNLLLLKAHYTELRELSNFVLACPSKSLRDISAVSTWTKKPLMALYCLVKLHWFLFWKKNSSILQLFTFLRGRKGKKREQRSALCPHILHIMWLKDAYIFPSIGNAVRRVHEKTYTMLISFCIILFSIHHAHYAKI